MGIRNLHITRTLPAPNSTTLFLQAPNKLRRPQRTNLYLFIKKCFRSASPHRCWIRHTESSQPQESSVLSLRITLNTFIRTMPGPGVRCARDFSEKVLFGGTPGPAPNPDPVTAPSPPASSLEGGSPRGGRAANMGCLVTTTTASPWQASKGPASSWGCLATHGDGVGWS